MNKLILNLIAGWLILMSTSMNAQATFYVATPQTPSQYTFEVPTPLEDGSFSDWVSFTVIGPVFIDASVSGTSSSALSFQIFSLYDASFNVLYTGILFNLGPHIAFGAVSGDVNGTLYYLNVGGTAAMAGAKYNGNISLSPIPENGTYSLLLVGIGILSFVARKRIALRSN